MGRQWFASLARGLGGVASLALLSLFLCVASVSADPLVGGSESAGTGASAALKKGELDQNFLLLPAYDLTWVNLPKEVKVGDTLVARISGGPGGTPVKVKVPPGNDETSDLGFDVQEDISSELLIKFTALKSGRVAIPSLALADVSGKFVARTNPIDVEVQSAIAKDDPKPKDSEPPKPPVSLGLPLMALVALAIFILGFVAFGVFWLIRWSRARRSRIPVVAEPPKPEDEVALAALVQLEKKGFLRSGQFKAHYFAVSEIIKRYVGARYGFDASESTTYEMLSHLREKTALSGSVVDSLGEIFDKLDRVKFTDYVPVSVEGTELLQEARDFVGMTRRPTPVIAKDLSDASR